MGGDHHRHAGLGLGAHDRQHLADQLGVEGGGDLVEQQQGRVGAERADQGGALLLAAGEPVGVLAAPGRRGRTAPAAPAPAPRRRRVVRRAPCAARACSCRGRSGAGRGCRPGRPCRSASARRGRRPAGRRSRGRRSAMTPSSMSSSRFRQRSSVDLPEPGRADQADHVVRLHGERDVVEHDAVAVRLAQVRDLEQRASQGTRQLAAAHPRGQPVVSRASGTVITMKKQATTT